MNLETLKKEKHEALATKETRSCTWCSATYVGVNTRRALRRHEPIVRRVVETFFPRPADTTPLDCAGSFQVDSDSDDGGPREGPGDREAVVATSGDAPSMSALSIEAGRV